MDMNLSKISVKELQAELKRRKGDSPLKDFYFYTEEKDEGDTDINFCFAHKRTWHLEHSNDDGAYDYIIRENLPKEFREIMESTFRFDGVSEKQGIKKLQTTGATFIKDPFFEDLLVHVFKMKNNKYFRIDFNIDTQEIKDILFPWLQENDVPNFKGSDLNKYCEKLNSWANEKGFHVEALSEHKIAVLDKKIWDNLPEFPRR